MGYGIWWAWGRENGTGHDEELDTGVFFLAVEGGEMEYGIARTTGRVMGKSTCTHNRWSSWSSGIVWYGNTATDSTADITNLPT